MNFILFNAVKIAIMVFNECIVIFHDKLIEEKNGL